MKLVSWWRMFIQSDFIVRSVRPSYKYWKNIYNINNLNSAIEYMLIYSTQNKVFFLWIHRNYVHHPVFIILSLRIFVTLCVVGSFTLHHKNQITLLFIHALLSNYYSSDYQYIYRKWNILQAFCHWQSHKYLSENRTIPYWISHKAHKCLCAECEIVCEQIKTIWFSNFKCWPNEWTFEYKR